MPKKKGTKKTESEITGLVNRYFQDFLSFLLSTLEEGTSDLLKKFSDLINFKRKLKKKIVSFVIFLAALIVVLNGIGLYVGTLFPKWDAGVSHILVGVVLIIISIIYKNSN